MSVDPLVLARQQNATMRKEHRREIEALRRKLAQTCESWTREKIRRQEETRLLRDELRREKAKVLAYQRQAA